MNCTFNFNTFIVNLINQKIIFFKFSWRCNYNS